ncbi:MAG: IS1 family transposase [Chthoniobacteraceae bacterium]|jgi:IS1 family transposase
MANVLPTEKQATVISALAEGNSIRSIERMTGIHRDTIMRLGVRVGQGCEKLMDAKMRALLCTRIEVDEIWGFVGKKQKRANAVDRRAGLGDVWTFLSIDPETKLMPSFLVGQRDRYHAVTFMQDLAARLCNRIQLSSDAMGAYPDAVEMAFGGDVDYGQIVKEYCAPSKEEARRYSPSRLSSVFKSAINGDPIPELVCTSYIERSNLTVRTHCRRLARLTLAFSKKLENFKAAIALHLAYYNFVKTHSTIRCTPAMAAGIERTHLSITDLIDAA